jgi:hypothetical protein
LSKSHTPLNCLISSLVPTPESADFGSYHSCIELRWSSAPRSYTNSLPIFFDCDFAMLPTAMGPGRFPGRSSRPGCSTPEIERVRYSTGTETSVAFELASELATSHRGRGIPTGRARRGGVRGAGGSPEALWASLCRQSGW